jgi:branched-chain amino acid transport system permease protein
MVGYAGLLDLGYVASFAIGAYTVGLLTTPSIVTTGCLPLNEVETYRYFELCENTSWLQGWGGIGIFNFWIALPFSILFSALTGMMLGVPVLGLRGDYLAIVTLGFGEITNSLIGGNSTENIFGGARGISNIPVPEINLTFLNDDWYFRLSDSVSIYYLYLACILITAFVVFRLSKARLGRAWRAMRADEDVAEATGIHLIRTKLLAFGISSAFAGMGGAIFGAELRGISPNSFTLLVSVNVLSIILIGGLGSIPGVVVGSFVLIGLPEVLRELQDYRLLVFGVLLVIVMLLKPEGLLPPSTPEFDEASKQNPQMEGAIGD